MRNTYSCTALLALAASAGLATAQVVGGPGLQEPRSASAMPTSYSIVTTLHVAPIAEPCAPSLRKRRRG